jgi:hypothetical protein
LRAHSEAKGEAIQKQHLDWAESIIDAMPPERTNEVCYLDVADTEFPVGFFEDAIAPN